MKRRYLVTLGAVALAIVLGSGTARADLVLGSGYNTIYTNLGTVGGGSFGQPAPNTLDGVVLPWVYCVDFFDHVYVPGTYPNATVTHNGNIAGSSANSSGLVNFGGTNGTLTEVNDAVAVAWLLHNYATAAIGDKQQQIGLQGAIWNVIYKGNILLTDSNSSDAMAAYNNDLNALNAARTSGLANYVGAYSWLSPAGAGKIPVLQGLITQVPDGGVTLMLLGGVLVGLETLRRRVRA
jgi:hypothetical protein